MKIFPNIKVALICALGLCAYSQAWSDEGSCEAGIDRQKKILLFKADSFSENEATVTVKPTCEDKLKTIRKCSVIGVQNKHAQRYCYPEDGTPSYYEIYDVIEYYETKEQ